MRRTAGRRQCCLLGHLHVFLGPAKESQQIPQAATLIDRLCVNSGAHQRLCFLRASTSSRICESQRWKPSAIVPRWSDKSLTELEVDGPRRKLKPLTGLEVDDPRRKLKPLHDPIKVGRTISMQKCRGDERWHTSRNFLVPAEHRRVGQPANERSQASVFRRG
ncbi:unnamed protein product [Soboliphyme baturini]|uniref:Uncharacterized protein n=1 Tax=Soboliphyme baturini TaxID=241478 RepID=A0A183ISP8_9BILA|nr:unnamed protein product [Soboliphyme baturini]